MAEVSTETIKAKDLPAAVSPSSNGDGYLTVDQALERAPSDCEERDVEVWGGKVRVKGLTAAQAARVKQSSITLGGRNPEVVWASMEMLQFELGVVKPDFSADQVRTLHLTAGAGFAKVIGVIDEISGLNKDELKEAQADFQRAAD